MTQVDPSRSPKADNRSVLKFASSFSKTMKEPDISLRKAAHDKFKRTQILEEAKIFQEKIQEKDVETDEHNISLLSSDNSMSDIIPSEFEGKEQSSEDGSDGSGNIMDEECKESVG